MRGPHQNLCEPFSTANFLAISTYSLDFDVRRARP